MFSHPFEKVTAILSGEQDPTMSSVTLLVFGLRRAITSRTPVTKLGKGLKRSPVIEKQLGVYESNWIASKVFLTHALRKDVLLWNLFEKVMPVMCKCE